MYSDGLEQRATIATYVAGQPKIMWIDSSASQLLPIRTEKYKEQDVSCPLTFLKHPGFRYSNSSLNVVNEFLEIATLSKTTDSKLILLQANLYKQLVFLWHISDYKNITKLLHEDRNTSDIQH